MNLTTRFSVGDKVYVVMENVFVERVDGYTTCFMNKGKPVTINAFTAMCMKNHTQDDESDEIIQREIYTFEGFHPVMFMGVVVGDKCNIFASRDEAIVAYPELAKKIDERSIITREQALRMMEPSVDLPADGNEGENTQEATIESGNQTTETIQDNTHQGEQDTDGTTVVEMSTLTRQ